MVMGKKMGFFGPSKQKKGLIVLIYLITETWRFPQVFPVTKLLSPESISRGFKVMPKPSLRKGKRSAM